jgi:DNA-binding NarL/FixJ family response regulator
VVIGEDDVLMREGIVRLLAEGGFEIVAKAGDAEDLLRKALAHSPDVVVTDVQMPPGRGDDGLVAALEIRPAAGRRDPRALAVLRGALRARPDRRASRGVGYLLKERVGDVEAFLDAVGRVASGGSALDPEVVGRMLGRRRTGDPMDLLTPRERDAA